VPALHHHRHLLLLLLVGLPGAWVPQPPAAACRPWPHLLLLLLLLGGPGRGLLQPWRGLLAAPLRQ
jgi:hypothetical protein